MLILEIEEWMENSDKEIKLSRSSVMKLLLMAVEREEVKKIIQKMIGVPVEEEPKLEEEMRPEDFSPQKQPEMTIDQAVQSLIDRIGKKIDNHRIEIERSETMQETLKNAVDFFNDEKHG